MKKQFTILLTLIVFCFGMQALAQDTEKSMYLVIGSEGPGFTSPEEAVQVLEKGILPTFEAIKKLMEENKIIAGGLPVGDRAMVFIVEASSNHEVDQMLRKLPAWGALEWKVKALESFEGRAAQERKILKDLKK